MSDATFLDNQEVTAEDLNNIAIDLGYPDYSHFPEETPPSAVSALNQITADLVSAGVLLTRNRCAVTYSNGNIYVDTGIIVFESGAKKRIETMQQLQALEGTSCVYALNNTAENTISLVCASEFPTDGDFVKLASVTGGVVTDTRSFATSKVSFTTLDDGEEFVLGDRRTINFGRPYNRIIYRGAGTIRQDAGLYSNTYLEQGGGTYKFYYYANNNSTNGRSIITASITISDGIFNFASYHDESSYDKEFIDGLRFMVF